MTHVGVDGRVMPRAFTKSGPQYFISGQLLPNACCQAEVGGIQMREDKDAELRREVGQVGELGRVLAVKGGEVTTMLTKDSTGHCDRMGRLLKFRAMFVSISEVKSRLALLSLLFFIPLQNPP